MANALVDIRDRVEQVLVDSGNAIWATAVLDEAIRLILSEFSDAYPYSADSTLTLAADGREIDISSLTGLINITEVMWPYVATDWPHVVVSDWRLLSDEGTATLLFDRVDGGEPVTGEKVRVRWNKLQEIKDLDSAAATTLQDEHLSMFIIGCAGQAAMLRVIDLVEEATADLYQVSLIGVWATAQLSTFRFWLKKLQAGRYSKSLKSYGGWKMDKWDD